MTSLGDKYLLSSSGFVYGPDSIKSMPMTAPKWVPDPNKPLNEQGPPALPPRERGKKSQSGKSRRRRSRRSKTRKSRR
jgi:hypothetical protein